MTIAATNFGEPKDSKPILHFLETWENLLMDLVLHNILDHIVMAKLLTKIDSSHPHMEVVPIHTCVVTSLASIVGLVYGSFIPNHS